MADVKLSVTILLPGSKIVTSQECEENPLKYCDRNSLILSVKHWDPKAKCSFYKKEPLVFYTKKREPAQQVIKMSPDAYEYMISSACPEWFIPQGGISKWKKMSIEQRLEAHLERTCKALRGISYTYVVFND